MKTTPNHGMEFYVILANCCNDPANGSRTTQKVQYPEISFDLNQKSLVSGSFFRTVFYPNIIYNKH